MRSQVRSIWFAAGLTLLAVGCTQSKSLLDTQLSKATVDGEARAVRNELPPTQAAQVCRRTADELAARGKEEQAIEQYERSRRHDPSQKGLAHRLALLYDRQGNYERAGGEYAAALKEDPKSADVWNDFGYFHYERQNWKEAERALRSAIKWDGKHPRAWTNLGLVLAEQERYDDALAAFEKSVSPAAAHSNVGAVLARQGKRDRARVELSKALQMDRTMRAAEELLVFLDDGPRQKQGGHIRLAGATSNDLGEGPSRDRVVQAAAIDEERE